MSEIRKWLEAIGLGEYGDAQLIKVCLQIHSKIARRRSRLAGGQSLRKS
jgi:hypothetical protein